MVLAAGLGTRMQPLTKMRPKPLIRLACRTLIDRVLDHLNTAGVTKIVVNTHYKSEMLEIHLAKRKGIVFSPEPVLLETGGGVKKALRQLGGPTPALQRMAKEWDEDKMDALLLFQRTVAVRGAAGPGDFFLENDGHAARRQEHAIAPYLFAGVQILHPRLFEGTPDGAFSLNTLYDRAEETGRLRGIVHDGEWYHVGTPEQRETAEHQIIHGNVSVNSR